MLGFEWDIQRCPYGKMSVGGPHGRAKKSAPMPRCFGQFRVGLFKPPCALHLLSSTLRRDPLVQWESRDKKTRSAKHYASLLFCTFLHFFAYLDAVLQLPLCQALHIAFFVAYLIRASPVESFHSSEGSFNGDIL